MNMYTANIDGYTFSEKTVRVCNFAWLIIKPNGKIVHGFSKTYENANSQARYYAVENSIPRMFKGAKADKLRKENKALIDAAIIKIVKL